MKALSENGEEKNEENLSSSLHTGKDYLELFKKLPHLNYKEEVIPDWGYSASLYHYDDLWVVDWINDDSESSLTFSAATPEEAIGKAYEYCLSKGLIKC